MDSFAVLNEKRFEVIIQLLDQSSHINQQLTDAESTCSTINGDVIPKLIEDYLEVETIVNDITLKRQDYDKLVCHSDEIDEIFKLGRFIEDHVDDPDNHDEVAACLAKTGNLHRNYARQCHLIDKIYKDAEEQREYLIANLCVKLETITATNQLDAKHIVDNLIRCGNFSNRELRLKYLQARDNWFTNACESGSGAFDDVVNVYSEGLPMIFNEYKSIFGHNVEVLDNHMVQTNLNPSRECGAIIDSWLLMKASIFIESLDLYLKDTNQSASLTPSLLGDTADKCFKLTRWLATIGFDFGPQLRPLFFRAILSKLERSIERATTIFEVQFTTAVSKSIESLLLPVEDEILRISDLNSAGQSLPKSIDHYPIFKIYCLHLIGSLRWLRTTKDQLPSISLCCEVYSKLNESLVRVTKALSVMLSMDDNSGHPILTKIAISFVMEVLPYIASHCENLFPNKIILNALGLKMADFKSTTSGNPEELENFRLDMKRIAQPLKGTMQSLVELIKD